MLVVMVVSISLAEMVNSPFKISNKKQSKIGIVLFEFKTPPMDFRCLRRVDAVTTKFIAKLFRTKLNAQIRNTKKIG
jgi:hypothetical protein